MSCSYCGSPVGLFDLFCRKCQNPVLIGCALIAFLILAVFIVMIFIIGEFKVNAPSV